jgi:hypothetical protein
MTSSLQVLPLKYLYLSHLSRMLDRNPLHCFISSSSYHLLNITNFDHLHHAVCVGARAGARVRTHRTHDVEYSRTPLIQTLVIRIANYPDRLGPSGKFVENFTKLTCLEITGYRIKYSTVSWRLELQIRRGRNV